MTPQDDPLEALIRGLGFTHCRIPECQTLITPATVKVGWENRAQWEHPLGGMTWLTCRGCGQHIKTVGIPTGRVVDTEEEAIAVLREA